MLFGFGDRARPVKRGGLLSGSLRNVALAGAGMLALRWWRNRRNTTISRNDDPVARNPVHGWQ
jgi:hypothetical protein